MNRYASATSGDAKRQPRQITGRTVFVSLVAFFAVVAAVNAVMMTFAVTTFSGVETANSYQAGVAFAREEAAAVAQDARHWRVNVALTPVTGAPMQVDLSAKDAANLPLVGLEAKVTLIHPNDRRRDHPIAMQSDGPGRFHGTLAPLPGQWDVAIELSRGGERLFRSRERIVLR